MTTLAAATLAPLAIVCGAVGAFASAVAGIQPFAGLAVGVSAISAILAWRSGSHARIAALAVVLAATIAYSTAFSLASVNLTAPLTPDRFASPAVPWLPVLIALAGYVTCAAVVRREVSVRVVGTATITLIAAVAVIVVAAAPRSLTRPGIGDYLDRLPVVATPGETPPLNTELESGARLVRSCPTCEVQFVAAHGQPFTIHSYISGAPFTVRHDRALGLWFFVADVGPERRAEAVNETGVRLTTVDVRVLRPAIGASRAVWGVALLGAVVGVILSLRRSRAGYATALAFLAPSSAPLIACAVLRIAF